MQKKFKNIFLMAITQLKYWNVNLNSATINFRREEN